MRFTLTVTATLGLAAVCAAYSPLRAQESGRSVWDGVFTQDQADRGKSQYDTHCALCHGTTLNGNDTAPALTGSRFLANWIGQSAGDLVTRTRTTMPANDPGRLSRRAVADITAYMFQMNQFPAGSAELPPDVQLLQQIRIVFMPEPQ